MATILLVDDRPINRQFLTTLLGYGGHQLLEASDGAEALSVITTERPDLIITDILMPTMNGYELVQHLRADPNLASIDVIFYTATYRASEARLLADACGVKHVLAKPAEPQLILQTVNTVLGLDAPDVFHPPVPVSIEQPPAEAAQETVTYVENKLSDYLNDLQNVNAQLVSLIGRGAELVSERDRLSKLSDEFSKNLADLQSINLKLAALSEFNFNLTSERNPESILEMLCKAAFKIIGASYVAVSLVEMEEEAPQSLYTKGSEPTTALSPELTEDVLRKNRAVRVGSFLGVPLSSAVQIYGLVTLYGKQFSREDEQFASTLASESAIAYENARLYNTIQSHAAKLQLEITERKRAEEALSASEQRFRALIENAPDGIALLGVNGKLQQITPSTDRILGYPFKQAINQDPAALTHPEDLPDLLILLNDLIQNPGKVVRTEYRFQHKDGSWRWLESTISNLLAESSVQALVFNYRDITESKLAKEALQAKNEEIRIMSQQLWQAAKLATMGELAASIAHGLNNPLATVSLRTEMLSGQVLPDSAQSKSLQIIESEVKRMSSLVANLLQYSRRSAREVSTCDVSEEIVNTLELIQYHLRKYNILAVQEFSTETSLVHADRQQLRQVFLNLFTNAADAMHQGGTLTVRTGPAEKTALGTTAPLRRSTTASLGLPVSQLPQIFIEVSDTGEGIPPENLDRVWEPLYTTKPEGKGTGLGLPICRRIIEEHGGTIEIISEGVSGKGTTVRIALPTVKGD